MRCIFTTVLVLALPLAAMAQPYSNAPILLDLNKQPAAAAAPAKPLPQNFPEWAVTNAAENTSGEKLVVPPSPPRPAGGNTPANAAAPKAPASPVAPVPVANPINALWPRDTVPIFVRRCAGFHVELIPACACVISQLMLAMPHDEFLKQSADGSIEQNPRLQHIRQGCVATPRQRNGGQ